MTPALETWESGDAYERWVGRWSRRVAQEFLDWLAPETALEWADVGCGTGVLAGSIIAGFAPESVRAIDRAEAFVAHARGRIQDQRIHLAVGDATALPWHGRSVDASVSGLVLNFVSDHAAMIREMARVTRPGGLVALYVWDYAGDMQMMRHFWDAAIAESPRDKRLDQAERFPICRPEPLRALLESVGLGSVDVRAIDVQSVFQDFDDFWTPFLGRQGAAPTYLATLAVEVQERIRARLRERLVTDAGPIEMNARAWAVRGLTDASNA